MTFDEPDWERWSATGPTEPFVEERLGLVGSSSVLCVVRLA